MFLCTADAVSSTIVIIGTIFPVVTILIIATLSIVMCIILMVHRHNKTKPGND